MSQNNNALITVIVPVYKVEKYLDKCVKSIINQTYSNLEIILVDDGSPDNCGKMCDEYKALDSRIKVIHKTNGGLSDARNVAIDIASGDYIGFVDSDDYIQNDMYEKLYEASQKLDSDITICGYYIEKDDTISMEIAPIDSVRIMTSTEAQVELCKDELVKNYAWNKLYKRELFDGIRYPKGRNYEDIATTYLLFDKAKRISIIPEYLYYYLIRKDSISGNESKEKWFKNFKAICESNIEKYNYYTKKGSMELKDLTLSVLVPYIYTTIKLSYELNRDSEIQEIIDFLRNHKNVVRESTHVSEKNKKIYSYYAGGKLKFYSFNVAKKTMTLTKPVKKAARVAKRKANSLNNAKEFFALEEGKNKRIIIFELPCFDNLGDHAIAFATQTYFEKFVAQHREYQLYTIPEWDFVKYIDSITKVISKDDIIICQGGGNMGSLYDFAEKHRKIVLNACSQNPILIMPQTLYISKDEYGDSIRTKLQSVYNSPKRLTIFARDHKTAELMRETFDCNIIEMHDMVASFDGAEYASADREGILLALRSDIESSLNAEDKKKIYNICRGFEDNVLISDTITKVDVSVNDRKKALTDKWTLFGKHRLVVTDRLHGMIFSLITKTPCVVLGNNHHKVKETYNTFAECPYLFYCDDIANLSETIAKAKALDLPKIKTIFEDYKQIDEIILGIK